MDFTALQGKGDERNKRKRSRSPRHSRYHGEERTQRALSPDALHHRDRQQNRGHGTKSALPSSPELPYRRKPLTKSDLEEYKGLLAHYLDVQKSLDYFLLNLHEIKGRWKSFMGKWNRGELARSWYDPTMQGEANEIYRSRARVVNVSGARQNPGVPLQAEDIAHEPDDEDLDEYGPALPKDSTKPAGPSIPSMDDLQHRRELAEEDNIAHITSIRDSRKQDRTTQKERLEELAPRADPGSRERQLEKKREATAVNRDFRDAKEAGDVEVREGDLMGGDDDGIAGYKAKLKAREKGKNEREIRKEEVLRARAAEREERVQKIRAKEEKTMEMLREIASQRFG